MQFRSKTLLAGVEAVFDTAEVLTGAEAVKVQNLVWNPYTGDKVSHEHDQEHLGARQEINTNPHIEFSFEVEIGGSGAAGTPPNASPFLRACGLSETVDLGVDVRYAPVSTGFESVTARFLRTGVWQTGTGARGSVALDFTAQQLPKYQFSGFLATYTKPEVAGVAITPTYTNYADGIPVTKTNTPVLTLDGYAGCVQSVNANLNNQVSYTTRPNCQGSRLSGRDGSFTITLEAPDFANKDLFALIESHNGTSVVTAIIEQGTVAGKIVRVEAQVQLGDLQETDQDGLLFYTCEGKLIPSDAGDDEILIIHK